ncbi:MAG: hypothetical protein WC709_05390 [Thermoleophilia bacterium]
MRPASAFGEYGAWRIVSWPWNPFSGEEMHASAEPGEFTYTTDGHDFTLTASTSGGDSVTP